MGFLFSMDLYLCVLRFVLWIDCFMRGDGIHGCRLLVCLGRLPFTWNIRVWDIFYVLFVSGVLQDSQAGRGGPVCMGREALGLLRWPQGCIFFYYKVSL